MPIEVREREIDFSNGFAFINGAFFTDRTAFENELTALAEAGEDECEIVIVDNIYALRVDVQGAQDFGDIPRYGEAAFGGRISDTIRNPSYEETQGD